MKYAQSIVAALFTLRDRGVAPQNEIRIAVSKDLHSRLINEMYKSLFSIEFQQDKAKSEIMGIPVIISTHLDGESFEILQVMS